MTQPLRAIPRPPRPSRFGDLEIVRQLARGGMGGVFLAIDRSTGHQRAIKVLDPQFTNYVEVVARFCGELTLATRAWHPGLVEIYDVRETTDGSPFLVMEYLEGQTAAEIARRGPIELSSIMAIAAQAASALAALHDADVIHCDVKPDNIFVLDDQLGGWSRTKLIDFGVSRRIGDTPARDSAIAGTPACMAPEQWRGRPTPKSDVYSLGCVLYELTTGEPPFDGSLPEVMLAHYERRPARPSWLCRMPLALERLILRMLAKDPGSRPEMADVAGELAELAGVAPALRRAS